MAESIIERYDGRAIYIDDSLGIDIIDTAENESILSFEDDDQFKAVIRLGLAYFSAKGEPIDHETEPAADIADIWATVSILEAVMTEALGIIGRDGERYGISLLNLRDRLRKQAEAA